MIRERCEDGAGSRDGFGGGGLHLAGTGRSISEVVERSVDSLLRPYAL